MAASQVRFMLAGLGLMATAAVAEAPAPPLSNIDWLSDSINLPPETGPVAPTTPDRQGRLPPPVDVLSLDGPGVTPRGLVSPRDIGLPPDLWSPLSAADAALELAEVPLGLPPTAAAFLREVLIARVTPPVDAALDDRLLIARIDKLLEIGHLDAALDLIDAADLPEDPRLFRRAFDIALLNGTESDGCRKLEASPDILPTFPARIFCLARNGEWDVAALTLGTAEALGYLTEQEDVLLLKFLDPDLFEDDPLPRVTTTPSPLVFRLYDAIGERLPTEPLPIAFAAADLRPTVGWKTQVRAAERLTAAGAMSADRYLEILFQRAPAASGGIWDRVRAIQTATRALDGVGAIETTLADGWTAAKRAGVAPALAPVWAAALETTDLSGSARHAAFEIALLADIPTLAARFASTSGDDRFLLQLASGDTLTEPATDALTRSIRRGLAQVTVAERFERELDGRGTGAALMTALKLVAEAHAGDADDVADALTILREAGQDDIARRIAVELLLEDRAA